MNEISRLITASFLMTLGVPAASQASLVTFVMDYSGAALGNSARAHGSITIEDTFLPNPQDGLSIWYAGEGAIASFSLTVTGASSGNGTFGLSDYDFFTWDTVGSTLNFAQNLVGQPTPGGGWGTTRDFLSGEFNFYALAASPDAPSATANAFQIATSGGNGNTLDLTSFSPAVSSPVAVPIPAPFQILLGGVLSLISICTRGIRGHA